MTEGSNYKTLQTYEGHIDDYIEGTPREVNGHVQIWIDSMIQTLDSEAKILEIGSAFGRDADYIEMQGFSVERTDATLGFVKHLESQGYNARALNILTDEIDSGYNLIFADAVFLHFTDDELLLALKKVHNALNPMGTLGLTLKCGVGEEWSSNKLGEPRYFHYWDIDSISQKLNEAGFSASDAEIIKTEDSKWLHIVISR